MNTRIATRARRAMDIAIPAWITIFFFLALSASIAQEPAPARLVIRSAAPSAPLGDTLAIEIRLEPGTQPVSVVGVFVKFDRQRLRFESGDVNKSVFNNNLFTSAPREAEPGVVSFSAAAAAAITAPSTLVASLSFTGISRGTTELAFISEPPRETLAQDNSLQDLATVTDGLAVSILPPPAARLFLSPPIRNTQSGRPFNVEVRLDAHELPIRLVEAGLSFDPALLRLDSASLNRNIFNHLLMSSEPRVVQPGVVHLRAATSNVVRGDNTFVAVLTFTPLVEGVGALRFLTLPPHRSAIADHTLSDVPVVTAGSVVAVDQGPFSLLSFRPATQSAAPGDQVQLDVRLDPVAGPARLLQAFVEYDPFRLRFDRGSVNVSVFDNPTGTKNPARMEEGLVSFLAAASKNLSTQDIHVATLTFTILSKEETTVRFRQTAPQDTQVRDESLARIPTVTTPATLTGQHVGVSQLVFEPQIQSVQPDDVLTVGVVLHARVEARFVRAYVNYDPSRLRFILGSLNTAVFDNAKYASLPSLVEPGVIALGAGSTSPVTGKARIATLQFQAVRSGVSGLQFLVSQPRRTSLQGQGFAELSYSPAQGWVTINKSPRLLFTFAGGSDNWNFRSSTLFDIPRHQATPGDPGLLTVAGTSGANSFGYWESPLIDSGQPSSSAFSTDLSLAAPASPGDFIQADFLVRSNVHDPARVPQFRLRATSENLQMSSLMTVESAGDGAESPDPVGRTYSLLFPAAPQAQRFTLSFDYLNFNPADDPQGALEVDWVEVKARSASEIGARKPVALYEFEADAGQWIPAATARFQPPAFEWSPGALTLSPAGALNVFGYWRSPEEAMPAEPGRMYIATFEIESSLDTAERARVPTFRCRVNETGFHTSAFLAVESRGDAALSPVAGNPRSFVLFYVPPTAPAPPSLVWSFDLLHFDPNDSSEAIVKLNRLVVESAALPW